MLAGIFESKSVQLSNIASKIPGTAMLVSVTRRLESNVLAHWKMDEKEPWLLATNLPSLHLVDLMKIKKAMKSPSYH